MFWFRRATIATSNNRRPPGWSNELEKKLKNYSVLATNFFLVCHRPHIEPFCLVNRTDIFP